MNGLKEKILQDLEQKIDPTAKRYGVTDAEFVYALDELVGEGKIYYTMIDDIDSPLHGIPRFIRLLMKN